MDIKTLTIEEASKALENKQISATELLNEHIKIADKADGLNIFITKTYSHAQEQAKQADERIAKDQRIGALDGIPYSAKDNYLTKGIKTTAASQILKDFTATYDATVIENLNNSGSVMLGKLNMDEFAMGSTNKNSSFGNVVNPWRGKDNQDYVPGGSSGGSAACVAASASLFALGSDTGGSIRQPAAFTGTVGFKPSYGTCSRYGIVAFASSLDQAGPLTKTVKDTALVMNSIASYDAKDGTMVKMPKLDFTAKLEDDVKGLRVGVSQSYVEGLDKEALASYEQSIETLKKMGIEIVEVDMSKMQYALPVYYVIAPAEASSNLARYDGIRYGNRVSSPNLEDIYKQTRAKHMGNEVLRRMVIGNYNLSKEHYEDGYIRAARIRRVIADDYISKFKDVDFILSPTTPTPAFKIDEKVTDPVQIYLNDIYTVPSNLVGAPAISIPTALNENGLPLGVQLLGNIRSDDKLLNLAYKLEQEIGFKEQSDFLRNI